MPLQSLTPPPPAPQRTDDADTFVTKADASVAWWPVFVSEMNTLSAQLMATSALINVAPAYADPGLMAMVGNTTEYGRSLVNTDDSDDARDLLGLAPFYQPDGTQHARIATNGTTGLWMDEFQTVYLSSGNLNASGRLRIFTSASVYGVSTYGIVDYNAMQFVREESGTPVERGLIRVTNTGTQYTTVSDKTMKEDQGLVTPEQAWTILRLVRIHNYLWKDNGKADLGPFAQDLYEVYPDAVSKGGWFDEEGGEVSVAHVGAKYRSWGVDHAKLVPLMAVALQDVDARLLSLESAA